MDRDRERDQPDDLLTGDEPGSRAIDPERAVRHDPATDDAGGGESESESWPERAERIIDEKHAQSGRQFQDENTAMGEPEGAGMMNSGNADEEEGRKRWREPRS